jgi:hypothetical protein
MPPVNVVHTLAEKDACERAKIGARKQCPEATGDRFYRTGCISTKR